MRLKYKTLINESEVELLKLEKHHRYSHLMQRVKMLRLLKTGECQSLSQVAKAVDYSLRQCQRWFDSYRSGGLSSLLENRIAERGQREWVNDKAWQALNAALEKGDIAMYKQAQSLLAEHGIHYKDETGILRLFRRHQIKLKTGRPVHEKADKEAQEHFKKNFAERLKARLSETLKAHPKPKVQVRVFAMDEARFGLINWHKRRYCPKGIRPPWIVRRDYEWMWLYAAIEPSTGESFCLYLPHLDGVCYELFLQQLSHCYPDDIIILIRDNAPAHIKHDIKLPQTILPLALPPYSPELNPAERWFLEFRRTLANRSFDTIPDLQEALTAILKSYWQDPAALKQLSNFPWWHEAVAQL